MTFAKTPLIKGKNRIYYDKVAAQEGANKELTMLDEKKSKSEKSADPWQERIPDTPENVALALLTTTPEDYKEQTEKLKVSDKEV